MCNAFLLRVACVLSVFLGAQHRAIAQISPIELPFEYRDFAMHPETGTLACVASDVSEVHFYKHEDLSKSPTKPTAKITVGSNPAAITYKQFGETQVFAVVCRDDPHLYVIRAGGSDEAAEKAFQLLKKVDLKQSGLASVSASTNPSDPFIYYCRLEEGRSGCVSLRDLKGFHDLWGDISSIKPTAGGELLYHTGRFNDQSPIVNVLTNTLDAAWPEFTNDQSRFTQDTGCLPDPFNYLTFVGQNVYLRGLREKVGELKIAPRCIFATQPVIIGEDEPSDFTRHRGDGSRSEIKLKAASYNSLRTQGSTVTLTVPASAAEEFDDSFHAMQWEYQAYAKYFADDARMRVVRAHRKWIHFVPLAEFGLPPEPLLHARLEGPGRIVCGQEVTWRVTVPDKRIQVSFQDLPEGMASNGTTLTWTPSMQQVGPAGVIVHLKHGELERTMKFSVLAGYPRIPLPFRAQGFCLNSTATAAAVWESGETSQYGDRTSKLNYRIAIVDLRTGKPTAQRTVPDEVAHGILTEEHFVFVSGRGGAKGEVLHIKDLEKAATLVAAGPISGIVVKDGAIILQSREALEIFNATTFKRQKSFELSREELNSGISPQMHITRYGLYVQGILYGFDLEPKLVLHPGYIQTLEQGRFARDEMPTLMGEGLEDPRVQPVFGGGDSFGRVASKVVPETSTWVSLNWRAIQTGVSHTDVSYERQWELTYSDGTTDHTQPLLQEIRTEGMYEPKAFLQLTHDDAFVAYGDSLFRWSIPLDEAGEEAASDKVILNWDFSNTTMTIATDGSSELKHSVLGAKTPVEYSVANTAPWITIDNATGTVTLDNGAIFNAVLETVETALKREIRAAPRGGLDAAIDLRRQLAEQILGRKVTGYPIAIPINVTASDADLNSADLDYFVIMELPLELLRERIGALADADNAPPGPPRMRDGQTAPNAADISELRRRVAAMEQQLELVSRQLELLLEKLERDQQP